MSVALQYASKCSKCGEFMSPGTPVDFVKDGKAYEHWHAEGVDDNGNPMDGCVAAAQGKITPRQRFDVYRCPHCGADWAFDKGAFERGKGVPGCPTCHKPWTDLYAEIEAAA